MLINAVICYNNNTMPLYVTTLILQPGHLNRPNLVVVLQAQLQTQHLRCSTPWLLPSTNLSTTHTNLKARRRSTRAHSTGGHSTRAGRRGWSQIFLILTCAQY